MKKFLTLLAALIVMGSMMVVQAADTWTPAGTPASVFTNEWTPNTPANDMVLSNGLYVFAKRSNFSQTAIQFKVCKNHGWDTAYPGGNYSFSIPAGSKYLIITYNTSGNAVNAFAISSMTVAGDNATLFGSTWDPTVAANDMELQSDDTYKFEQSGVALSAGTVNFKACANHKWDNAWPSGNYSLSIPESGNYTITITFDPKTLVVSATADLEEAVVVIPNIQLHSNIQNPSWASTANFDIAGNNETASLTLENVSKGNYEFGVKIDGTWTSNGSAFTRDNNSHAVVAGSDNCTFNADRNGDYTFTWTYATNTLSVTYPAVPTQSVTFNSLASEILKGSVINLANCVTSSGIDEPTYRFYIKEKNGSYGDAINANYNFNANGEYVVKVEALENGEPVAYDESAVVVYQSYTFTNGTTIYVDFSAMTEGTKGVNYPKVDQVGVDYDGAGAGTIKAVTFTANVTWTTMAESFIKTEKNSWANLPFTVPGIGKNCAVVAADGASYTWDTYEPAPPTIKLHGDFTGSWANTDAFILAGNKETASLALTIPAKGMKSFGVRIGSDDNWTSNGAAITRANAAAVITSGEGNCSLNADIPGEYIFTWTYASNTLSVTYPELPSQFVEFDGLSSQILKGTEVTFAANSSGITNPVYSYFVKPEGGEYGSAVAAYTFNAEGNFVVKVSAEGDNTAAPVVAEENVSVYDAHTFTSGTTIFVDFSAMIEGTKGVNYPSAEGKWLDYDVEGAGNIKTVIFSTNVTWTTNDVFIKTEKAGWAELKFSVPGAGENCAVVAADGASYTWTTYVAPDPVYTVAGSASAFGTGWDLNAAANEMTLDGGVYKLTKTGLELIAGDIEFKVVKDHDYANGEWPAYPNNYVLNIAETGKYTIAITFDPTNAGNEISATATKTGEIVIIPTVKVKGSWDWSAETTLSGDETSVSATINLTPADTYYFKMIVGGDYRSNDFRYHRDFTGAEGITMNETNDMRIEVDKAGDYTFTWTFATNALSITFPDLDLVRDNLSVGKWGTLCPKQTVENVRGADFYQISHLEEQGGLPYNMVFEQIVGKTLTAGQPYFFIASAEKIEGAKTGDAVSSGSSENGFHGYIGTSSWELPYVADYDPAVDNTFVIYDNSVYRINQAGTMLKSERCYIKINATVPSRTASSPVPGRARFMINVNGHNTPTGIDQITNEQLPMTNKVIIDGQLFIIRGEKMYNANGIQVK